jgi:hypothetical protein
VGVSSLAFLELQMANDESKNDRENLMDFFFFFKNLVHLPCQKKTFTRAM